MSVPRRRLPRVALYVIYLVVVTELTLRLLLSSQTLVGRLAGDTPAGWEQLWLARHSSDTAIYYAFDRFDERRGWMSRESLDRVPAFGDEVVSTDAVGFRNSGEASIIRQPGITRVVVLGDSFTFGDEVSDDQTFPFYLGRLLPGVEVLNMGVHGYGHDQMLLLFEDEGARYAPDLVVLGFVAADMLRNVLPFRDYAKPWFTLEEGRLLLHGVPVPHPERTLQEARFRSAALSVMRMLRERFTRDPAAERERIEQLTAAILDRLAESVRAAGARLVMLYIPTPAELADPDTGAADRAFFDAYCRRRALPCTSALQPLEQARRAGVALRPTGHWDAPGNRVIAESIRARLCDGLLDCSLLRVASEERR